MPPVNCTILVSTVNRGCHAVADQYRQQGSDQSAIGRADSAGNRSSRHAARLAVAVSAAIVQGRGRQSKYDRSDVLRTGTRRLVGDSARTGGFRRMAGCEILG